MSFQSDNGITESRQRVLERLADAGFVFFDEIGLLEAPRWRDLGGPTRTAGDSLDMALWLRLHELPVLVGQACRAADCECDCVRGHQFCARHQFEIMTGDLPPHTP